MKPVSTAVAALSILGMSVGAQASCLQNTVGGVWQAYSFNNSGGWVSCRLIINSAGTVGRSTCTTSSGEATVLTRGKLTLNSGPYCTFTGSFRLGTVVHSIEHATVARGKSSMEGVGKFQDGSFTFSMTKI